MGGKKKSNSWPNTGNQDENYIQNEPPDPPDRATQSRTWMKMEGTDERMMQTDMCSASAEHSNTRTTSQVEETPKRQTLLQEDMPVEDTVPISRNTDKGKGRQIPSNSEDKHNTLLSPQ